MNIENYVKRFNYEGDIAPTLDVLTHLQETHLLNVPFENLDIHYKTPILLDLDRIYRKIVERRRGGFCYELNGLFYRLLRAIGFEAKMISARVYSDKKEDFGAEYDHLAIIVTIDEIEYLVDVGFGEFAFRPLKFEMNKVQSDSRGDFIFENHENGYIKVSKITGETKSAEYIFTKQERSFQEFGGMCHYQQTSPDSHFTQKKLITRPTPKGRITLSGTILKITEDGVTMKEQTFDETEFGMYLREWFDMDESSL
ncbi:arylamine N-acetyltransferase [Aureisphaera galaxeae]|uniref:arylamine N-acetyltransferase family protein n=1 Tax=Aureisphaera galaxeae TaxID=1538023 RepID=UPI0023504173|nr:arylamine N-acetyltransferase [Aureisphaera galaxeae]MDC8003528.1 arylamine N-acetyltransferase [Aureisphaera galaxeae]